MCQNEFKCKAGKKHDDKLSTSNTLTKDLIDFRFVGNLISEDFNRIITNHPGLIHTHTHNEL